MNRYLKLVAACISGIVLGILTLMLSDCATIQLPKDATGQQKSAAYCQDVATGLATAQIGLSLALSPEQSKYWSKWIDGALKAQSLYCGAVK